MIRTDRADPHDSGMIRKFVALTLVGVVTAAGLVASGPHRGVAATATRIDVLFIGNSLLGTRSRTGEDTPDLVRRLAPGIRTTKVIRFGSTLQRTWDTGPARTALNGATRYDYIVLQEYSTLVATDPARATATLLRTYAPALPGH